MKREYRTPYRAEVKVDPDDQYHFLSVNLRHLRSCDYYVTFMRVFPTGLWGCLILLFSLLPPHANEQGEVIGVGVYIYIYVTVPDKRDHFRYKMIFQYKRF